MGRYSVGRAMDVIREMRLSRLARHLGAPLFTCIAFIISGTLAGLGGALQATSKATRSRRTSSASACWWRALTMVVLGGRTTVLGRTGRQR